MSVGLLNEEFIESISVMHEAALPFGKSVALLGAGFTVGKNVVKVIRGNARSGVAVSNAIRDVIISFGLGYAIGFAGIGEKISQSTDLTDVSVLNASSGTALGDTATIMINRILGMIYFSGADTDLISMLTTSFPAFGLSLLIGIIFAFLFD